MIDNITLSEKGTLLTGIFFRILDIQPLLTIEELKRSFPRGTVVLNRIPKGEETKHLRAELSVSTSGRVEKHVCGRDKAHVVTPYLFKVGVDLFGGPKTAPITRDSDGRLILMSKSLTEDLGRSKLTGFQIDKFKILVNQSDVATPDLLLFQLTGRNCERIPSVVVVPNKCPFCSHEPLICPECGYFGFRCERCLRECCIGRHLHEGKEDQRLTCDLVTPIKDGRILEGRRWDGSDFIGVYDGSFMSRRAKDWFEARHVGPLVLAPARFCTDEMNDEQKLQLEEVGGPKIKDK